MNYNGCRILGSLLVLEMGSCFEGVDDGGEGSGVVKGADVGIRRRRFL